MNTYDKALLAIQELRREKRIRKCVYPKLIAKETLRETEAANRMRLLDYAIEILEDVLAQNGQQSLFPSQTRKDTA